MKMPVKSEMAAIIGEAWPLTFTTTNIVASFAGAGIFPVDMARGTNRVTGRGTKRKAPAFQHQQVEGKGDPTERRKYSIAPLLLIAGIPLLVTDNHPGESRGVATPSPA